MDMTKDLGAGPYACPYRWRPMTWEYNGKEYLHERATATQQTGFSFVAQSRSDLPDGFGGILWFGVDDAGSNCYMPMFCGITKVPYELQEGNGSLVDYSPTAAFWKFTKVSQLAYSRYSDMIKHINQKQDELENHFIADIRDMQSKVLKIYESNPQKMREYLTEYSNRAAKQVCEEWDHLFEYLLVKYNDGNVKQEKEGRFLKTNTEIPQCEDPEHPAYPERWYKMIVDDCGKNIEYKH
jgi:dipeptidase